MKSLSVGTPPVYCNRINPGPFTDSCAEPEIHSNAIRKLYLQKREAFYDAILGAGLLVPEGDHDYEWLRLLQRISEASDQIGSPSALPLSVVPTQDASIIDTYKEVYKLRPDAVPIVDGDKDGDRYLDGISKLLLSVDRAIRWGDGAAIECVAAWVLQPALPTPGLTLKTLLPDSAKRNLAHLQNALSDGTHKKNRELREDLAFEALDKPECVTRASDLLGDIAAIVGRKEPRSPDWRKLKHGGLQIYVASHIRRESA